MFHVKLLFAKKRAHGTRRDFIRPIFSQSQVRSDVSRETLVAGQTLLPGCFAAFFHVSRETWMVWLGLRCAAEKRGNFALFLKIVSRETVPFVYALKYVKKNEISRILCKNIA